MTERHKKVLKWVSLAGLAAIAVALVALFALIILPQSQDLRKVDFRAVDPTEVLPERGRPIPPLDVAQQLKGNGAQLKLGQTVYKAQCASCHGAEGLGNGAAGSALNPPPRNFASSEGWKNGYTVSTIFETLTGGLKQMPAFDYLPPLERFALAHYVQNLGQFSHGAEAEQASQLLDQKYHLSQGGREPNRVSAKFALGLMLEERRPPPPLEIPAPGDLTPGALVLRRVILDAGRAAQTLAGLATWREDRALFTRAAAAGAPVNGFAPGVASLSELESEQLHAELQRRIAK